MEISKLQVHGGVLKHWDWNELVCHVLTIRKKRTVPLQRRLSSVNFDQYNGTDLGSWIFVWGHVFFPFFRSILLCVCCGEFSVWNFSVEQVFGSWISSCAAKSLLNLRIHVLLFQINEERGLFSTSFSNFGEFETTLKRCGYDFWGTKYFEFDCCNWL